MAEINQKKIYRAAIVKNNENCVVEKVNSWGSVSMDALEARIPLELLLQPGHYTMISFCFLTANSRLKYNNHNNNNNGNTHQSSSHHGSISEHNLDTMTLH